MSIDLKLIGASDTKGDKHTCFLGSVYGPTLSTHVGGYNSFSDLLNFPHKKIPEDPYIDDLCFTSYAFKREDLENALRSSKNKSFKDYMFEYIHMIPGPFIYIQLI